MSYANQTLYELYQVHVGPTANLHKLNGVGALLNDPQATYHNPDVIGRLLPSFKSLNTNAAEQAMTTFGLGQLFATNIADGLNIDFDNPYSFDGTGGAVFTAYWAAMTAAGGISDVGKSAVVNKGVMHLQGISAQQDAAASATVRVVPIYDGSNEPVVYGNVASLNTTAGALSAETQLWTVGDIKIDNTLVRMHQGFTYANIPLRVMRAEGQPYNMYSSVGHGRPVFRIPLLHPMKLHELGIAAIAGFGTLTDPPVAATSATFNLQRMTANGKREAVGTGDIDIVVNYGDVTVEAVPGGPGVHLVNAILVSPHDDKVNSSISITKNAD